MSTPTGFFKKSLLVWPLFAVLGMCLFLGDGKQTVVDIVAAGGILGVFALVKIFLQKQREPDTKLLFLWVATLFYLIVRTVFSDDVGFSVYSTIRYIDAFLVYYLFYCYITEETYKVFVDFILLFCVFSLVSATVITLFPSTPVGLPLMNLLSPTYGHNHVVDILLFGFPTALLCWIRTKQKKYLLLLLLFLAGTVFSFARAALVIEAVVLNIAVFFVKGSTNKRKIILSVITLLCSGIATISLFFPYQQLGSRIPIGPKQEKQNNAVAARLGFWEQSLEAIKTSPIIGSGPGTFSLISRRYQNAANQHSWFAHNYILETAAENGIIGIVLIVALIGMVFFPIVKRNKISFIITPVVVFLYSLSDYSANYIVVWFLLWAFLGALSLPNNKDTRIKNGAFGKTMVLVCIVVVGFFYIGSPLIYFFPKASIVRSLDSRSAITLLNTNNKEGWERKLAIALHKKNPDVVFAAGDPCTAFEYDPQNTRLLRSCLEKNIKNQPFGVTVLLATANRLRKKENSPVQTEKPIDSSVVAKSINSEYFTYVNNDGSVGEFVSKSIYYIGLQNLSGDATSALALWSLATAVSPGWGHFWVELSSLQYSLNDTNAAKKTLSDCQKYRYPAKQCQTTVWPPPPPGTLKEQIKAIPKVL